MITPNFITDGYETMELSTQVLIKKALEWGVEVAVINRDKNMIQLSQGDTVELVLNATKTTADNYVTISILGDKSLTKVFLEQSQIQTPSGREFSTIEAAADFFDELDGKYVIKPTNTNYGIGITILEKKFDRAQYLAGLEEAFDHDTSVIVEKFAEGIECRFLVIDGVCRGVLHRMSANVIGDGISTIKELVDAKNQHPFRGKSHTTPLEKIQLGVTETKVLAEKNLSKDSIPEKEQPVFLRKNSNISTGGDSIDYTTTIHNSYINIAEKAATTINAKICGVDIIIKNISEPLKQNNYSIIELNYNPVLYFHDFPSVGTPRESASHILTLLGFKKSL